MILQMKKCKLAYPLRVICPLCNKNMKISDFIRHVEQMGDEV